MINYSPVTRLQFSFEEHNFQKGKEIGMSLLKNYLEQGDNEIYRLYIAADELSNLNDNSGHEWGYVPFIANGFFEIKSEWYELDAFVENRIEGEIQLNLCCGIGGIILNVNDLVRHQRQINKHIG
ncbi:hypothetical protein [Bacillus smithii]|uniref:hypothetical protein n=1 Tax=Bacillus smithii TaxID=1479 RepID=UPI002E225E9A|nr:hypothetical protein [Bacillus smithii]MED4929038.1 hypothetical protein [Bacillus smithii]